MSFETAYNALRNLVGTTIQDSEGIPVVYDNSPSFGSDQHPDSPPDPQNARWARIAVLPGETSVTEMSGEQNTFHTPGVLLVSLFGPLAEGDGALLELLDVLNVALRLQTAATYCTRVPTVSAGRRDGEWWRIDLAVPFFFDVMA